MTDADGIILGFDPGGTGQGKKGNFGWSICKLAGGQLQPPNRAGLAKHVEKALQEVSCVIASEEGLSGLAVLAAGIDAPMFWNRTGDRKVDRKLRERLSGLGRTPERVSGVISESKRGPWASVLPLNSLRGACLVQGALLGMHLKSKWPRIAITESHPAGLDYLLWRADSGVRQMVQQATCNLEKRSDHPDSHKLDATLAAVSAWAMLLKPPGWRDLYSAEPFPVQPFGMEVGYWMPVG